MNRYVILLMVATVIGLHEAALAHRLDADCVRTDQGFRIEFFTGDGSAASDLRVTARLAGGEPIEIGRTDQNGVVQFVPPSPGEWTIVGEGAGGHSTVRNPLVISAGVATTAAASDAGSRADSSTVGSKMPDRSQRGRFPWTETIISLAFIAILTAITMLMMRRTAHLGHRHSELDQLAHEVSHLRSSVAELRAEVAELKAGQSDRDSRIEAL